MSEQNRSRLYAWLCDQTDEPLAEYVMSCLAPAPLSDLVTKDHLSGELSRFATKEEMQAGFDKLAAQRDADRDETTAQREADRERWPHNARRTAERWPHNAGQTVKR
ncbi:hypothetical protein [Candidatus Poriferisodalis sp.]|uniref:hypothetical protein n=1 Tax=Candidatus Poriferisodalis sp. TaxID=3101277 RepID=UPI003B016DB0